VDAWNQAGSYFSMLPHKTELVTVHLYDCPDTSPNRRLNSSVTRLET
jgi:hypothetical protein